MMLALKMAGYTHEKLKRFHKYSGQQNDKLALKRKKTRAGQFLLTLHDGDLRRSEWK